jgi:hypothetical protein
MRLVRYVGVMFVAGLVWTVVSALLRTMGVGQGVTALVGFLLLVLLGPVLFALASGGGASGASTATTTAGTADATDPTAVTGRADTERETS